MPIRVGIIGAGGNTTALHIPVRASRIRSCSTAEDRPSPASSLLPAPSRSALLRCSAHHPLRRRAAAPGPGWRGGRGCRRNGAVGGRARRRDDARGERIRGDVGLGDSQGHLGEVIGSERSGGDRGPVQRARRGGDETRRDRGGQSEINEISGDTAQERASRRSKLHQLTPTINLSTPTNDDDALRFRPTRHPLKQRARERGSSEND